jgi:hypothetical protein
MQQHRLSACFLLFALPTSHASYAAILDFEGFPDSTVLTTQYPGASFENTIILTAGISLNEFEFPPHSGNNVASDDGGPMSITFSSPILSFGGYFTYAEPLMVAAFDAENSLISSADSKFANNEALSGDPGSSPDEFIQVASAAGISRVTITGDPSGASFALDDATIAASTPTPEPGSFVLVLGGLLAIVSKRRFR